MDRIEFAKSDELLREGIDIRVPIWRMASCAPIAMNAGQDRLYFCGIVLSCSREKGMSVMACDATSLQIHEGFASGSVAEREKTGEGAQWDAPMEKGIFIGKWSSVFREARMKKHIKHWFRIFNGRAFVTEFHDGGTEYSSTPVSQLNENAEHVSIYADVKPIIEDLRNASGNISEGSVEIGINPKTFTLSAGIPNPYDKSEFDGKTIVMRIDTLIGPVAITRPGDPHFLAAMMPVKL